MEACDTSMEKFYTTMHKMKETKHIDILLKRMINHVRNNFDQKNIFILMLFSRLLMHCNFSNQKEYFIAMLNHQIF
jgi:hypothetical protein